MTGYWKGVTTSDKQTFSYSVGITSTNASSTTDTDAKTISDALETGWDEKMTATGKSNLGLMEAELAVEVAHTHKNTQNTERHDEIAKEISNTMEVGRTTSFETECAPKDNESWAGLWQWVLSTSDYTTAAFTSHTVCRTGELAFTPPSCHWDDCDDD